VSSIGRNVDEAERVAKWAAAGRYSESNSVREKPTHVSTNKATHVSTKLGSLYEPIDFTRTLLSLPSSSSFIINATCKVFITPIDKVRGRSNEVSVD
jgi:hypothetical protein